MGQRARRRRTLEFLREFNPQPQHRILDVGGSEEYWAKVDRPLRITLLNLERERTRARYQWQNFESQVQFDSRVGDGCDLSEFETNSFDIVFSNAVIEHVGDDQRVAAFASEARRVGKRFWVQTPARSFPIEAHTYLPFYWYYPVRLRRIIAARIDRKHEGKPWFQCPISQTRGLKRRFLRQLFPGSKCFTERFFGWPKSYAFFGESESGDSRR
jgi:SAM-dependent methyltransferase